MSHGFETERRTPVVFRKQENGSFFADFGKDAFSFLELVLESENGGESVEILIGEAFDPFYRRIERNPLRNCTLRKMTITLKKGRHAYRPEIPPWTGLLKSPVGCEIAPFRYCEVSGCPTAPAPEDLVRIAVYGKVPLDKASFHSSDEVLNEVWKFCQYTIRATTLFGCYIDGERERLPYEGDSYLTALSHYSCDADYSLAKRSIDYLMDHPTWPTEYFQLLILLAYDYYMYSGDKKTLSLWYPELKKKLLLPFAFDGVLLDLKKTHEVYSDEEIMRMTGLGKHFAHWFRDMVDWPSEERDFYQFGEYTTNPEISRKNQNRFDALEIAPPNFVPNAMHLAALKTMAEIAGELGEKDDLAFYTERAGLVREALRSTMLVTDGGGTLFRDCPNSSHTAIMTDALAIFAGVAEPGEIPGILRHLREKKMRCSVYGATFVLSALFRNGCASSAIKLMADDSARSWKGMLRQGATITMETWGDYCKDSQDWNHSWGTAPLHIIAREMFGIRPLTPGFRRFSIEPQIAFLRTASIVQPTVYGSIKVDILRKTGEAVTLSVEIPQGTEGVLLFDGKESLLKEGNCTFEGNIPLE